MKPRLEWKVGLFVLAGLILAALLLLSFSKGVSVFRPTYTILLHAENIAGLQPDAQVLVSGVKVGAVGKVTLDQGGKTVTVPLIIDKRFVIPRNSRFTIEQAGFLGDQYVGIEPIGEPSEAFEHLQHAQAERPFNLQEAARNATGLIQRLDEVIARIDEGLQQVRQLLLNPTTLTNLAAAAKNLRVLSDQASVTLSNIDGLITTNSPGLHEATANLVAFSERMSLFSSNVNDLVLTNRDEIQRSIQNVQESTESLKSLLQGVEEGKGLAGAVFKDEQLSKSLGEISANLSITTSNLNRRGLWGILWRQKDDSPPETRKVEKLRSPRDESR